MAGARSLWRANGMREEQFGRPVIGIANSFTQLVPGHVHLHEIGQYVKQRIEALGCFAAEFNTIAIDDGIAMGARRHALFAALARDHCRQRRIYGQRPQGRRTGLHLELRQDHPGHADGRHAARHPDRLRIGRARWRRGISASGRST